MRSATTYFWHRHSVVRGTSHTLTRVGFVAPFGCFCSCNETQTLSQKGQLYPLDLQGRPVVVCSQTDCSFPPPCGFKIGVTDRRASHYSSSMCGACLRFVAACCPTLMLAVVSRGSWRNTALPKVQSPKWLLHSLYCHLDKVVNLKLSKYLLPRVYRFQYYRRAEICLLAWQLGVTNFSFWLKTKQTKQKKAHVQHWLCTVQLLFI